MATMPQLCPDYAQGSYIPTMVAVCPTMIRHVTELPEC